MKLKGLAILAMIVAICTLVASASTPPTPFMIYGYIYYENGTACNNPMVQITNTNTSNNWSATANVSYSYYQLMLANGTDVNASETLRFDVTSPDGSQSKIMEQKVTLEEVNNGGKFNFDITLKGSTMPSVFDTGTGTYPSISGTHNGTIIPDEDIAVNRLYTYSCTGTGGHTEYVRIWNESENVDGQENWSGYTGDYHNVTISPAITLLQGHTYNYTIKTGSYPLIVHTREHKANSGGNITCTKFTDANGKVYEDWIPAIRLFYEEQ